MKVGSEKLDQLLNIGTSLELRQETVDAGFHVDSSQAQRLLGHLESMVEHRKPAKLAIVHTYTSELLDPWIKLCYSLQGLDAEIYHAPYGVTIQEAQIGSGLHSFAPDLTLLMLQREDLHPSLSCPLATIAEEERNLIREEASRALENLVQQVRATVSGQIVVTILPAVLPPGLGWYDIQSGKSESYWWEQFKREYCSSSLGKFSDTLYLDLDELVSDTGRKNFFDMRFWYSSRFPFSATGGSLLANAISKVAVLNYRMRAKVLVLDADNTLWGGVVGEAGISGIALGPDYPGNVFLDFQKRILGFQQRGFLLALCSKNNMDDVQEVFDSHPHQLLRSDHFVAQRVNWLPKSENIRSIAQELNLGLDSFIFVDDSAHECAEVRHNLSEVEIVQVPSRKVDIPFCLDHAARLEVLALTSEDLRKTKMYAEERKRKELKEALPESSDATEYLKSLNMSMVVSIDQLPHVRRLAQLTQKTNQYNLTTRRYQEQELEEKIAHGEWSVFQFSLSDSFGDSGLVGLAIVEFVDGKSARLDSFLMSCRVIGRKAEDAFLKVIIDYLRGKDTEVLYAEYIPTRKNAPVKDFLSTSGFRPDVDGRLCVDLANSIQSDSTLSPINIIKDFQ